VEASGLCVPVCDVVTAFAVNEGDMVTTVDAAKMARVALEGGARIEAGKGRAAT
jgi:hypothetical protein